VTEPLRYRRRRRLPASRPCRACGSTISRTALAEEFWAGPTKDEFFHAGCAPTTLPGVLICPACLRDMHVPTRWDSLRGKREYSAPRCARCQGGDA
jgi:hypothetical protein